MWHSDIMSRLPATNMPVYVFVCVYLYLSVCLPYAAVGRRWVKPGWQQVLCARPNNNREERFWLYLVLFFSALSNNDDKAFFPCFYSYTFHSMYSLRTGYNNHACLHVVWKLILSSSRGCSLLNTLILLQVWLMSIFLKMWGGVKIILVSLVESTMWQAS